jgi:hypothetical protein
LRDFSVVYCGYTLFWSIQPFLLLSLTSPLPLVLHFSTAFSTHPCIRYHHRCCVLRYY